VASLLGNVASADCVNNRLSGGSSACRSDLLTSPPSPHTLVPVDQSAQLPYVVRTGRVR